METEYITRTEFALQVKRIEEEENRQNHRIGELETDLKSIRDLTVSVKELAVSIGYMKDEIAGQRKDLEAIKSIPSSRWDKVIAALIGAAVTALAAYVMSQGG